MEVATRLDAEPSVGHRVIVRLAQRDGWPIITTNFDCFLEMAAADLGIDLDVRVPEPWHRKLVVANSASQATLIKLHGSAGDYTTVKSTAADLSRCSIILKRMRIRPQPHRILVIGYSGRDFDLFPWLASAMADCEVLWVDRSFASGDGVAHRAETLPNALTWTGEWNNLAEEVIDDADRPGSARRPDTEIARDYRRTVLDAVRNNIASIAARPGATSVAALIGVFASVGAHRDVAVLMARADDVADPDARVQTLLWGAHANSSIDRFHTALMLARLARKLGWRTLSFYSTGRAAIAISYAQVANRWLAVLPGERLSGWDQLRKLLVVLYVPMVTAMYASLGLWSIIRMTRTRKLPATAQYRFAADYLEHLVRLTALLERLRDRVPGAGRLLDSLWRRIQSSCGRIGYTTGVFNVSKYLSRQTEDFDGPEGALTRALAIGDLLGETLARRDIGSWLVTRSRDVADEAGAGALRDKAAEQLNLALRTALHLGCPSLVIKILLLLKEVGIPCRSRVGVARLIDQTECVAITRDKARIIAALV
ncbi:MAG TPA: SIR2 family protein [Pseudonocardiaceae bacterium]|nr:SIR2 family protein [Pseudonocardiaceae bacterium]